MNIYKLIYHEKGMQSITYVTNININRAFDEKRSDKEGKMLRIIFKTVTMLIFSQCGK